MKLELGELTFGGASFEAGEELLNGAIKLMLYLSVTFILIVSLTVVIGISVSVWISVDYRFTNRPPAEQQVLTPAK